MSRGIYLAYELVSGHIQSVKFALPDPVPGFEKFASTDLEPLSRLDPTRVLYNALIPFAVAAFEHFFSRCFKILLCYDHKKARRKFADYNKKVKISDVMLVESGSRTIEDLVAEVYSFQSIESVHRAFNYWFGMDIWGILRKRKRVGKRLPILETKLRQLIEIRHGIVHRFSVDYELDKHDIQEVLDLVLVVVDSFVDHLESALDSTIRD